MYHYLNGKIVKKEEAVISPFDHGYMYGLGLFETFRMYDGHPFLLGDHLRRLRDGLEILNIDCSIERNEIENILSELLEANRLTDAYVRLNISAGIGDIGLQTDVYTKPTLLIMMKELPYSERFAAKQGKILKTIRNTPESDYRLKSHHYLNNVLAKREIQGAMNTEGIFLTKDGDVAEGIVSNVFWYKDGTLYTPSVETGILNGITRQFVLSLARKLEVEVEEGLYSVSKLLQAEEVFVTNSIQEIVPLTRIEEAEFSNRSLVPALMKEYKTNTDKLWSIDELN